jgi:hypothetical protein
MSGPSTSSSTNPGPAPLLRHVLANQQLASWAGADVRTAPAHVIARITTGPARYRTALGLVTGLWNTDDPTRVPATW